jgi:hypothetical protein
MLMSKDLERSDPVHIEVLFRYLLGGTKKNHKTKTSITITGVLAEMRTKHQPAWLEECVEMCFHPMRFNGLMLN